MRPELTPNSPPTAQNRFKDHLRVASCETAFRSSGRERRPMAHVRIAGLLEEGFRGALTDGVRGAALPRVALTEPRRHGVGRLSVNRGQGPASC